jgi:hypothetical protein
MGISKLEAPGIPGYYSTRTLGIKYRVGIGDVCHMRVVINITM